MNIRAALAEIEQQLNQLNVILIEGVAIEDRREVELRRATLMELRRRYLLAVQYGRIC